MRALFARIPLVQTMAGYRREWLRADLIAGVSVCLVMVPSVVAYAGLAGLPPVTGLYAALAALIGYTLFASARLVIAGPDAALTLLVGVAIAPLVASDPSRAPVLAAALSVIGGLILLLMALLRAGIVADFLSKPVLVGYFTGAALILISTQAGKFFGISLKETDFFPIIAELWRRRPEVHGLTTWLGLGLIALQIVMRIVMPKLPSALLVFTVALAVSYLVDLEKQGVALVGSIVSGLPTPSVPLIDFADLRQLIPGAFAVALLTVPEGILLARAFAARRGEDIKPNQEIVALGAANLLAGLFQGFSVGASQSRTVVNESAGGRTPISGIAAAVGLVLFLLFLTPLLAHLPKVALAAILVFAGAHLIEVRQYRELGRFDRKALALAVVVMLGVLVAGVLQGILLGVGVSLIYVLGRMARPMDAVLREVPAQGRFHDLGDEGGAAGETVPGIIAYRFYAPILFANGAYFVDRIRALIAASPHPVRCFILDAQAIPEIDSTALEILTRLAQDLRQREISFRVARANRPLREMLIRSGVVKLLADPDMTTSVHAAVQRELAQKSPAFQGGPAPAAAGAPAADGAPAQPLRSSTS